jgi:hypothetical protein
MEKTLPQDFWYQPDSITLRRRTLCCVLSFSEYEANMKRRDGSVVHTQMGKKTVIKRLFMVRGGTLKMMPSSSGPRSLNFSPRMSVRYSQMRSRCQLQLRVLTGSRTCQASFTKVLSASLRTLMGFADAAEERSLPSFLREIDAAPGDAPVDAGALLRRFRSTYSLVCLIAFQASNDVAYICWFSKVSATASV